MALEEAYVFWVNAQGDKVYRADSLGENIIALNFGIDITAVHADHGSHKLFFTSPGSVHTNQRPSIFSCDFDGSNLLLLAYVGNSGIVKSLNSIACDDGGSQVYWINNTDDKIQRCAVDVFGNIDNVVSLSGAIIDCLDVVNDELYWTDNALGRIRKMDLVSSGITNVVSYSGTVRGIDVDTSNEVMYVSRFETPNISTLDISVASGSLSPLLTSASGLVHPTDIAHQRSMGLLYWMDQNIYNDSLFFSDISEGQIEAVNIHGGGRRTVLSSQPLLRGFGVDAASRAMFFVQSSNINRCDLDGSNAVSIVTGLTEGGIDVAVDPISKKVFFVNYRSIRKCDYDGSNLVTIFDTGGSLSNSLEYLDIDLLNNRLYFTDTIEKTIKRCDFDGSGMTTMVTTSVAGIGGISLDPTNSNLYYAFRHPSDSDQRGVYRNSISSPSGVLGTKVASDDQVVDLAAIVDEQRLYYIKFTVGGYSIRSVAYSGGSSEDLITTGMTSPSHIINLKASNIVQYVDTPAVDITLRRLSLGDSTISVVQSGLASPTTTSVVDFISRDDIDITDRTAIINHKTVILLPDMEETDFAVIDISTCDPDGSFPETVVRNNQCFKIEGTNRWYFRIDRLPEINGKTWFCYTVTTGNNLQYTGKFSLCTPTARRNYRNIIHRMTD